MNSKLAIVLAVVLGFAVTTVVFAQEAEQAEVANTEIETNTMDNTDSGSDMENQEEAPAADSSAPVTY